MVSAIESLAQDFDGYSSTWEDVDVRKRVPIDEALECVESEVGLEVRAAILTTEHLALGRRYREFVLNHVDESYYRTGDALVGYAIAQCDLVEALRQAYFLRSKYVHQVLELPDELTLPHGHAEVSYVDRQPTLTFQGLARLTRHVIRSFIDQSTELDREIYDYRLERAGVVEMPLAPEYWVANPLGSASESRKRLEGFIVQLAAIETRSEGAQLTDLRPVLLEIERLIPQASKNDLPAMAALHILFNINVPEECRTPNARISQSCADLELRIQEKDEQIRSLEEKHAHARDAMEHYRSAIKEQREQDQRRHETQLQQLQHETLQLQQTLMVRQDELTRLNRDNERLLGEARQQSKLALQSQDAIKQPEGDLGLANMATARAEGAKEMLQEQFTAVRRSNEMLSTEVTELRANAVVLGEELSEANKALETYRSQQANVATRPERPQGESGREGDDSV